MSLFSLFAEDKEEIDVVFTIDEQSANYKEIGFSQTEVSNSRREPTYIEDGSFTLVDPSDDLDVIATGSLYAFWKVSYGGDFRMELSGTPLSNGTDTLHWHASWIDKGYPDAGTSNKTFHSEDDDGAEVIYTHRPAKILDTGEAVGSLSIDSVLINIETDNGSSNMPGTYEGTLTLTVYGE